jgi:hypothetical protein
MLKKTLLVLVLALLLAACTGPVSAPLIDDFERDTLPSWQDPNGIWVGYVIWGLESGATVAISTTTPSEQVPGFPKGTVYSSWSSL